MSERRGTPVTAEDVEAEARHLMEMAEMVRDGRMEAYHDPYEGFWFYTTPKGIAALEAEMKASPA